MATFIGRTTDTTDFQAWWQALCNAATRACEVCGKPATHVVKIVNGDNLEHEVCQTHLDKLASVAAERGVPIVRQPERS